MKSAGRPKIEHECLERTKAKEIKDQTYDVQFTSGIRRPLLFIIGNVDCVLVIVPI